MRHLWQSYRRAGRSPDTFYEEWLSPLFFEAFNQRFQAGRSDRQHLPPDVREAMAHAPYLNGGLFTRNVLDERHPVCLPDSFFATLFESFRGGTPGFLERYNFTVSESTPLDLEVAVDPEMIGRVYESLVNVSGEQGELQPDKRGELGIFYTPRVEIDLMCRLALVDCLANHLGQEHSTADVPVRSYLYEAVFAFDDKDKERADRQLADADLWPALRDALAGITVCDPACGSGSFLVGMLLVLDDLLARADRVLGHERTSYERRRDVIRESLYGVDVMEWAVHVAELRLWLQLVIETELPLLERQFREPLLPNLTFKVRPGDSLVQEVGGVNLGLHRHPAQVQLSPALKGRLTRLKALKRRYYHGEARVSEHDIRHEEARLFRDILREKEQELSRRRRAILMQLADQDADLTGKRVYRVRGEDRKRLEDELAEVERALASARGALAAPQGRQPANHVGADHCVCPPGADLGGHGGPPLREADHRVNRGAVPFVWDLAFVEVFEGEKKGFDIVIGNPPYVRQERIAPPGRADAPKAERDQYKAKLQRAVWSAYPRFFGYDGNRKEGKGNPRRKLDGKSDLYVYFYLYGLSLLNDKGSFCFITSNSWLDVEYGADLQEFLLRHSHVKLVIDNAARRSFSQADVNTVIALLGPADDRHEEGLSKTARFVSFRVPFEQVLSPVIFQEVEEARERASKPEYRLFPIGQRELLAVGMEVADSLGRGSTYGGDKWGGKYLRAPDIYYVILEKGKDKLVRLGDIAEVRRGITTGANEFFYLDREAIEKWDIEEEFLRPVIKSPRECRSIIVRPEGLRWRVFMCRKDKEVLQGTAALEYVRWGESQGFHSRPSCRGRARWWDLPERDWAIVLWPMIHGDQQRVFWNEYTVAVDHNLFEILRHDDDLLWGSLCWTGQLLFRELHGRANLGQGALKTEGIDIRTLYVLVASYTRLGSAIRDARHTMSRRHLEPVVQECLLSDRRALDDIVFDALGLTQGERDAVYEAVVNLVEGRLRKAESLQGRR